VTALRESLAAHPSLSVTIIVDNNRGTRKPWPQPSTASLLYPFVRDFGPRVNVRLYQSPSRVAKYFPERFREGFGTWHSKIYTGDSEVILTG
jgi:CDP-diacylglycerol---glycerol-3-phosphate 3-phosphatidyltransferase